MLVTGFTARKNPAKSDYTEIVCAPVNVAYALTSWGLAFGRPILFSCKNCVKVVYQIKKPNIKKCNQIYH